MPLATLAVKAAPSVRLMARKLGIDLATIPGSGPGGRVLVQDLSHLNHVARRRRRIAQACRPSRRPTMASPATRIKLIGLRRKIAERMVQSKRTIPHYSYMDECDVTDLVRLRDSLKDTFSQSGVKLTYLAFFVKAVVAALKEVPIVNASLEDEAGEIVLHDRYHIGVAVATPGGLIVPVVRDADKRSLAEVAKEIERLSAAARSGKATRDELIGSTFTVTSIGSIGGLISTPVINPPEVGILGIGKVTKRPVYDAGRQPAPRRYRLPFLLVRSPRAGWRRRRRLRQRGAPPPADAGNAVAAGKTGVAAPAMTADRADLDRRIEALLAALARAGGDGRLGADSTRELNPLVEQLHAALAQAGRRVEQVEQANVYLRDEIQADQRFTGLIGDSPAMQHVRAAILQVAKTDSTALILGETGTGKELIARAIHKISPRRQHLLVKVNCAALAPGVIASELFGHEAGAFTGAATAPPAAASSSPTAAPSSSTRSAKCRSTCRCCCCACCRSASSSASAATMPSTSMSA